MNRFVFFAQYAEPLPAGRLEMIHDPHAGAPGFHLHKGLLARDEAVVGQPVEQGVEGALLHR